MPQTEPLDIHAYLDGELGPEEAAEIEALLDADPAEQARLDSYARQKEQLGAALGLAVAAGPASMRTARLQKKLAAALHRRSTPRRIFGTGPWICSGAQAAAACALVAFGWWGHASWSPPLPAVPEYVSEAVGAHMVFAEDHVRPAEFTGDAVNGAAEWFSTKIGVPVNPPDLAGYDITLVGARLLGTKEGPLAQFIYEDGDGLRYSLTLARHPVDRPVSPLQVVDYPDRSVGYWSTPEIDFALIGQRDSRSIQALATNLAKDI